MKRTLIIATMSYAGMGPYVNEIVNLFKPDDNINFIFFDHDGYYQKNVKPELIPYCKFFTETNTKWVVIKEMLFGISSKHLRIIKQVVKENNINIVHYLNSPVPIKVVRFLDKLGVKTLGTIHDLYPHETKKALHKMFRSKVSQVHRKINIENSENLSTNSLDQYEELKNIYPDKNIFYFSFPSLVTKTIEQGNVVPNELIHLEGKPYILFFGRIEEYKGLRMLYNVFTSTPELYQNYYLVIAGKGDVMFKRSFDARNVIWVHRYIADEEVKCLYENASCVVYPYISATQSGVLSLAFYFNTPVLASDVSFFKNIIEPNKSGILFCKGDNNDLREKLLFVLNNNTSEMVKNAKITYNQLYRPDSIRRNLLDIYNRI